MRRTKKQLTAPRALFLVVGAVFSLLALGHEARINPQQREAIQARLRQRGCFAPLAEGKSTTRGLTRGGRRSVSRGDELPQAAQQYSDYFSEVIRTELELPYGKQTEPSSHEFFRRDPYEGPEKIKIQEELGIRWKATGPPTSVPKWIELAKNYREALVKRGIDPDKTFVPAFVFFKEIGGGKREYLFIDPVKEKFPEDMSEWQPLTKDVQFNVPFAPIYEAMQQGKFPLLDAAHDVSHFVSFLRFPEFAQAVRSRLSKMTPEEVTSAFKGREYWLTEALSLPDPSGQPANQKFLKGNGRSVKLREVAEIEQELEGMSEKALIDYAYKSAKQLESQLRDVSGGNSNSAEKWYYLSESFGMSAEAMLEENLEGSQPIKPAMELANVYFNNAPVSLHANPKALTNETATFNLNTFAAAQKFLALSLKENKLGDTDRKEALKRLVQFTSRTEHLLTQKPFTYEEWADAFLKGDLPKDEPIPQMLTGLFPNDAVYRYYLGRGQPRPPKPRE
jgi:hypothetical protein